jgi:ABC-type dipeptide/oligopeptide/nickel transport system ATPase component
VTIQELMPRPTERMMIVGASGSGKTTLARALLQHSKAPRILVIDPKCTYGGPEGEGGYEMVRSPRDLRKLSSRATHIQYRPDVKYQNTAGYDEVYEWMYRLAERLHKGGKRTNLLGYTDETFQTMRGTKAPDWQRNCITCGRELGLSLIFSTQRPRGIDPRVLTEAESTACFHLRNRDDRKTMSEVMGEEVMVIPPRFAFFYVRDGMIHPRLARLDLSGGKGD